MSRQYCVVAYERYKVDPEYFIFFRTRFFYDTLFMTQYLEFLMTFNPLKARQHAFFYVRGGTDCMIHEKLNDIPPLPKNAVVNRMCREIRGMLWDSELINKLLFEDKLRRFSNVQAWKLASAITRSFNATQEIHQSRILALMTVSSREDSLIHCLSDEILKYIGGLVLTPSFCDITVTHLLPFVPI